MKRSALLIPLLIAGCAGAPPEIRRLSPLMGASKIPIECRLVSVLADTPAQKAGMKVGDILKSVNGQVPTDAYALSDVVSAAPADSDFEVLRNDGSTEHLKIHLNAARPRLGSVCDLGGWVKPGVTAAGNESVTVFDGPFALTASGIIDKNVVFLRLRLTNNLDKALEIGPALFQATDGSGAPLAVMSPKEVMCFLYGDKGAHLLALKKKHKETLDAHESVPDMAGLPEDRCEWGAKGKLSSSDPQYAEANAQYLATESLWPATYQPGGVADGLIYLKEPPSLPVTITGKIEGHTLSAQLGKPQASEVQMKRSELTKFFEGQKRGNSLRLTLRKGKVFVGKFSSYDSLEERVWFSTPSAGMLNSTSFSVEKIRSAEPLDQVPTKAVPVSSDLN